MNNFCSPRSTSTKFYENHVCGIVNVVAEFVVDVDKDAGIFVDRFVGDKFGDNVDKFGDSADKFGDSVNGLGDSIEDVEGVRPLKLEWGSDILRLDDFNARLNGGGLSQTSSSMQRSDICCFCAKAFSTYTS